MRPRRPLRPSIALPFVPTLLFTCLLGASPGFSEPSAPPAEAWQRDLRVLLEELEAVHPDPWFHAERATVQAAADELHDRLPQMTWEESVVGFHRIVARLRDGHTRVLPHESPGLDWKRVQVIYQQFPDGLHVIAAPPDRQEILGGRVLRIGGVDADEAWARMEPLVPADNEWTVRDRTPRFLTMAALLTGLGITDSSDECPLEVEKGGRTIRTTIPCNAEHDEAGWPTALSDAGVAPPLYLQHPEKGYFFEHLPEHDAVYLLFRRVRDDEGETFAQFCDRAFGFLDENEVGRLIVDLRLNGGGNNYLNRPLIHGIIRNQRVNQEGRLFVITGRRTFSAAMCGTIDLERQTNALFVGEPTGATPNHHGDAVSIPLPNTGLTVGISSLFWQNSDPRDRRPWLEPDVPVELTWEDYLQGRDPALEAALRYEPETRESIATAMNGWLENGATVDEAIARYRDLRESEERTRYDLGEYQLNAVGYGLVTEERIEDALAILHLNVEMFPRAFNPWDSLGEVLAMAGRTDEAIAAYARSVELNPSSRSGQTALRRLKREADRGH